MDEPLDESYFNWLCAKVRKNPAPVYYDLFRILYKTEFIWTHGMDKNRADDGRELREFFSTAAYIARDEQWFREPCSVFEMLIAFADRVEFQTDVPLKECFWEFIENLHLEEFRRISKSDEAKVRDILDTWMYRMHDYSGEGGLFPLRNPVQDQRKVEIFYQLFDYLRDKGFM